MHKDESNEAFNERFAASFIKLLYLAYSNPQDILQTNSESASPPSRSSSNFLPKPHPQFPTPHNRKSPMAPASSYPDTPQREVKSPKN